MNSSVTSVTGVNGCFVILTATEKKKNKSQIQYPIGIASQTRWHCDGRINIQTCDISLVTHLNILVMETN